MGELSVERVSDQAFVVTGELDVGTIGVFDSGTAPARDAGDEVVLDLSGVTFVDSSGLGRLIDLGRTLQARRARLVLREPSPKVRHVLEQRGLERVNLWRVEGANA